MSMSNTQVPICNLYSTQFFCKSKVAYLLLVLMVSLCTILWSCAWATSRKRGKIRKNQRIHFCHRKSAGNLLSRESDTPHAIDSPIIFVQQQSQYLLKGEALETALQLLSSRSISICRPSLTLVFVVAVALSFCLPRTDIPQNQPTAFKP